MAILSMREHGRDARGTKSLRAAKNRGVSNLEEGQIKSQNARGKRPIRYPLHNFREFRLATFASCPLICVFAAYWLSHDEKES